MSLRYDEIVVLKPYHKNEYVSQHAERVKIDPSCFKHKKYPRCVCGRKYLPKLGCLRCKKT